MDDCIFCKIVRGEIPSFKVWEDEKHIAFLDIYPAVEGMTIIVPKEHHDSYIVNTDASVMCDLMKAVQQVGRLLDFRLENVLRTKVVFEGVEVNHLHAKLLPMYKGELEIMEVGDRASDEELEAVARKITGDGEGLGRVGGGEVGEGDIGGNETSVGDVGSEEIDSDEVDSGEVAAGEEMGDKSGSKQKEQPNNDHDSERNLPKQPDLPEQPDIL